MKTMTSETSFRYVFYNLLSQIEEIEIEYEHTSYPGEIKFDKEENLRRHISIWTLRIKTFSLSTSPFNYQLKIVEIINSTINYLKENRIDLLPMFNYFIEKLTKKKSVFEELINSKTTIINLIESHDIILNYTGHSPTESEFHQIEYKKNDYEEIFYLTRNYFSVVVIELARLILYLEHELNLATIKKDKLENQKGKEKLLTLIKLGKIEQLFQELNKDEKYKLNEEIIQLSARYFKLEEDKNKDIISRDKYDIQFAKLISSIISAITRT